MNRPPSPTSVRSSSTRSATLPETPTFSWEPCSHTTPGWSSAYSGLRRTHRVLFLGKTDELELSGGINRFSRETISSIPAGVMMSKRCIFCKNNSTGSKALEHIVPESLGNEEHTLPPGIVCDPCNNYFASGIEQPVLESGYFLTSRFNALIPNKRRRMPSLSGILLPGYRNERQIRFHRAEVSRDARGDYQIFAEAKAEDGIASGEISRVIIPASGPKPDRQLFSRFLAKVAVECMAQRLLQNAPHLLSEFVDDEQVDLARNYARFGRSGLESLLSKTDRNLATRVANGGFGCPELEI